MKKSFLTLLSLALIVSTVGMASAKTTTNGSLASAIRAYKSGNYVQSYTMCQNIVKKDPSNAFAYYYLAISSVQMGKKDEAIENYEKVIDLSTNRQLTSYATKGKTCIEDPDKCNEPDNEETIEDKFIRSRFGSGFSDKARGEYEKQKIENLMREINRNGEVSPNKFKNYKDFSSEAPTNDQIVEALRVLQKAGLSDFAGNSYSSDLSLLTGRNNDTQILNYLTGNGNSNIDPRVIQSLLTNQMGIGF